MKSGILTLGLAVLLAMGCSHSPKSSQEQTRVTQDNTMLKSEVVTFEKGSAELTSSSKQAIQSLVDSTRQFGTIDEAEIAVWSDRDTPVDADLADADRKLAQQRIDALSSYLGTLNVTEVESYNMAERSNWLARIFNTDDAEVKSEYARADSNALNDEELRVIRERGAPSKAVIVLHRDLDDE